MRAAKALASLRICADSPDADTIRLGISCAGPYIVLKFYRIIPLQYKNNIHFKLEIKYNFSSASVD